MSIVRRIILGYALFAVLFVAAATAFGVGVILVYNDAQKSRESSDQLITAAEEAYIEVTNAATQFRIDAVTLGTGQGEMTGGHSTQVNRIVPIVEELQKNAWNDASRQRANDLRASLMDFAQRAEDLDNLQRAGDAYATVDAESFKKKVEAARSVAEEAQVTAQTIVTMARGEAATRSRSDKRREQVFQTAILALFAVGAGVAVVFGALQPRSITRRLRAVVNDLGSSAAETLSVASSVSAGVVQTATAVSEAATTIDEVRQTSVLTSQKATAVADTARSADEVAESGRAAVARATDRMHGIHDQMTTLADSVASLVEQTESASGIIATINDISEQSRMLSVNAAIEAVKAADLGHGFGVVAEEIKDLAVQSKQGVASVRSVLGEIQRATSGAVMAVDQSSRAIEIGVEETDDLRQAIDVLADAVATATQSALQIQTSAQQELIGMDQISDAIGSIDQASARNAAGASQLEIEAEHLRELARRLEQIISSRPDGEYLEPFAGADDTDGEEAREALG